MNLLRNEVMLCIIEQILIHNPKDYSIFYIAER